MTDKDIISVNEIRVALERYAEAATLVLNVQRIAAVKGDIDLVSVLEPMRRAAQEGDAVLADLMDDGYYVSVGEQVNSDGARRNLAVLATDLEEELAEALEAFMNLRAILKMLVEALEYRKILSYYTRIGRLTLDETDEFAKRDPLLRK